jgi:hypothetical protein
VAAAATKAKTRDIEKPLQREPYPRSSGGNPPAVRSAGYPAAPRYRDPESQAFIESWFGTLKERCLWREELETLDQARDVIAAYVTHYHHRPHSRLDYRTPLEVAATWNDGGLRCLIPAA